VKEGWQEEQDRQNEEYEREMKRNRQKVADFLYNLITFFFLFVPLCVLLYLNNKSISIILVASFWISVYCIYLLILTRKPDQSDDLFAHEVRPAAKRFFAAIDAWMKQPPKPKPPPPPTMAENINRSLEPWGITLGSIWAFFRNILCVLSTLFGIFLLSAPPLLFPAALAFISPGLYLFYLYVIAAHRDRYWKAREEAKLAAEQAEAVRLAQEQRKVEEDRRKEEERAREAAIPPPPAIDADNLILSIGLARGSPRSLVEYITPLIRPTLVQLLPRYQRVGNDYVMDPVQYRGWTEFVERTFDVALSMLPEHQSGIPLTSLQQPRMIPDPKSKPTLPLSPIQDPLTPTPPPPTLFDYQAFITRLAPHTLAYAKVSPQAATRISFPQLASLTYPPAIPELTRFEHCFICAPSGGGKTTLLTQLLQYDFARVAGNQAAVIVVDSTEQLADSIVKLKRFAPGGDLEGRLIHLKIGDISHPVAMNLFSMGSHFDQLSDDDRLEAYNTTMEMIEYIFTGLMGMELSTYQSTLLRNVTNLLFHVPDATMDTMYTILNSEKVPPEYLKYVVQLEPKIQDYFRDTFPDKKHEVQRTKQGVVARLDGLVNRQPMARIFCAPENRFDWYTEMSKPNVIIVDAPFRVLRERGLELFSRIILASILDAAFKRSAIPEDERFPVFCYVDECAEMVKNDTKIRTLLRHTRKLKLGITLATQNVDAADMSEATIAALLGGTAIKFGGEVGDSNRHKLAREMGTLPEAFTSLEPFQMMLYVRHYIKKAIAYQIPPIRFTDMLTMSTEEVT
jgi:hypothetical protein